MVDCASRYARLSPGDEHGGAGCGWLFGRRSRTENARRYSDNDDGARYYGLLRPSPK